mmetsp:Transcript_33181/g.67711  ORF Transcript_33181/g.67711 Transcript_33181/m.67711 type:complete len:99 (-) Transcript_33181:100-396(-)
MIAVVVVDEDWSIVDYGGDVMIVVYHYHSTTASAVTTIIDEAALSGSVFSEAFLVLSLRRAPWAKLRLYCGFCLLVVKCIVGFYLLVVLWSVFCEFER